MTKFKDVAHLYLGCEGELTTKRTYGPPKRTICILDTDLLDLLHKMPGRNSFKPRFRPLVSMTDDYFVSLFRLAIGAADDAVVADFRRLSTNELYARLGFRQSILGFSKYKGDERIEEGCSFYIKQFLVKHNIIVTKGSGIREIESWFNNADLRTALNQTTIFKKLLQDGYDLFGLIESGEAIDGTGEAIDATKTAAT